MTHLSIMQKKISDYETLTGKRPKIGFISQKVMATIIAEATPTCHFPLKNEEPSIYVEEPKSQPIIFGIKCYTVLEDNIIAFI